MTETEVRDCLEAALSRLYRDDLHLLRVNANERSLTHRLACHLTELFAGWHVDCEYNRLGGDDRTAKRLLDLQDLFADEEITVADEDGKTIYPDIIVHKRSEQDNLLVIEAKKSPSNRSKDNDRQKLERYLRDPRLEYRFGAFVCFYVGEAPSQPTCEWFRGNDEFPRKTLPAKGFIRRTDLS